MNVITDRNVERSALRGKIQSVEAARRCPKCGRMLYMKLGDCSGNIAIKCQKCGKTVNMNLALRKASR